MRPWLISALCAAMLIGPAPALFSDARSEVIPPLYTPLMRAPGPAQQGRMEKTLAKTYPLVQTGLGIAGVVATLGTPLAFGFAAIAAINLCSFARGLGGGGKRTRGPVPKVPASSERRMSAGDR